MPQINNDILADAILHEMQSFLGRIVYDVVMTRIIDDYLGGDADLRKAILQKPEAFESAFLGLLGDMGAILLSKTLGQIEFRSNHASYSKQGDFARYVTAIKLHK